MVWCCMPRFDSTPVFDALLQSANGVPESGAMAIEIGGTNPEDSIVDWKLGVTYDLSGFLLGASYIGTNRDLTGGTASLSNRNISNGTVVVSVSKSF